MHRTKWRVYSVTSSAMAGRFGGTVMPSTLGVLRLMNIARTRTFDGVEPLQHIIKIDFLS
jgi:hypothetical protein